MHELCRRGLLLENCGWEFFAFCIAWDLENSTTQRRNTLTTCWQQGWKDFKCPWVNLCDSSLILGSRQNCQSLWPAAVHGTTPNPEVSYPLLGSPWGWWACCRRRLSLPASRTAEKNKTWLFVFLAMHRESDQLQLQQSGQKWFTQRSFTWWLHYCIFCT